MGSILDNLSLYKLEELLARLAAGFGVALFLEDADGRLLAASAAVCEERSCRSLAVCQRNRTLCREPLFVREQPAGCLAVCLPEDGSRGLAAGIGRALESSLALEAEIENLSSEIVGLYEKLSLIHTVSGRLGSEMDMDTICRMVLLEAERVLAVSTIFIMLLDGNCGDLTIRSALGSGARAVEGFRTPSASGLVGHVFRQGAPVTVCDIAVDGRLTLPYPATSVLCVPLITDARPIGMLIATDKLSGEEFWSQELQLMGIFAPEVAATIRKASLYNEINKLFLSTVEALATAIDAKDPYTYGHSRRVARYAMAICNELGMKRDRVQDVELASLLHDIGKIGTPESILCKPDRLQPDEFEKIKEHPATGAEILSTISELGEIITWIRHHHEWYDGQGYPDRIAAASIPLEARVIAVADAFDAMTSDRPYRKGMSAGAVLKIMEQFNRSQFDPHILQAFSRCVAQGSIV
jgi:putative nucleotidyltransferase with HDIG domain